MLLRGRSKDRTRKVTPPGPVSMSNEQFADYLADLRSNRVARPSGARPQPASNRRESTDRPGPSAQPAAPTNDTSERTSSDYGSRSASAMSHRRAQSSLSTYSVSSRTGRQLAQQPSQTSPALPLKPSEVVPSATYIERGLRWMEKEEAVSLREAMEDLDIKKQEDEEARIHSAAQNEASELVYRHQNPEVINPDAPYRYNDHLRKNSYAHARTQSVGRYGGMGIATGLARDLAPRSVSGGSSCSGGMMSPRDELERSFSPDPIRPSLDSTRSTTSTSTIVNTKSYGSIMGARKLGSSKRRSSAKRNISGEIGSTFTGSQIWEEPEESTSRGRTTEDRDVPAPLRFKPRNPLSRVQFAQDVVEPRSSSTPPEKTKKFHKTEIHQNPPTQSRNPLYTANSLPVVTMAAESTEKDKTEPATKDGLEIRSDDIRQATSMRLKDRSPKLPTPTVVSDKPGRPIVSFESNWKPKEADVKPEVRRRSPFDRPAGQRQSIPTRSDSKNVTSPLPTVHIPESRPVQITNSPVSSSPTTYVPDSLPSILTIKTPDSKPSTPKSVVSGPRPSASKFNSPLSESTVPTVTTPQSRYTVPTINTSQSRPLIPTVNTPQLRPSIPTINTPQSRPSIPTINTPQSRPSLPAINAPQTSQAIPTINLPNSRPSIPTINVPQSAPSVPTINFPDAPSISVSAPGVPSINVSSTEPPKSNGQRPLPDPKAASSRPRPHGHTTVSRGHWSPAPTAGKRATATCHQCTLPIEGRVVAISGKPEHFHPECFICFNCGTGLESLEIRFEPETKRAERIDRIKRRARGEDILEIEGQTLAEDGDERLRFFCHLDWHEAFAPKCKHCKTPIIGEHTIALGEHWHYGHFFCAECGDPFEKGQTHIEKDGYAWCLGCQTKRTERRAPKCKKCKKPVIGQYVQALGGEWHDECFRCHECGNGFDDGCFYPKDVGGETHVLCMPCLQMQLKA